MKLTLRYTTWPEVYRHTLVVNPQPPLLWIQSFFQVFVIRQQGCLSLLPDDKVPVSEAAGRQ